LISTFGDAGKESSKTKQKSVLATLSLGSSGSHLVIRSVLARADEAFKVGRTLATGLLDVNAGTACRLRSLLKSNIEIGATEYAQ
jgi:MinD superfamily P-loop ATPase